MSQDAYDDMMHITRATDKEVAWFAEVDHYEDEDTFLVRDVFLPHQQTSSATTEIEPEHLEQLIVEFLETRGDEAYAKMRCWGHSHHTMGITPSSQDDQMIDMLAKDAGQPFIAIRTNHRRDMAVDIAYPGLYTITDIDFYVGVRNVEQEKFWKGLVKERVKDLPKTTIVHSSGRHSPTYPRGGGSGKAKGGGAKTVGHGGNDFWSRWPVTNGHYDDDDDEEGVQFHPCEKGEHKFIFDHYGGWPLVTCSECGFTEQGEEALRIADEMGLLTDAATLDMLALQEEAKEVSEK